MGCKSTGGTKLCAFLTGCRTAAEHMLRVSVKWGPKHRDVLQTFQNTVIGPHLHEDQDETWGNACQKMCWTDLHKLLLDIRSAPVSLDVLEQKLKLPKIAAQLNAKDTWSRTPLYYAITAHPAAVEVLLRAGANPWLVEDPLLDAASGGSNIAIGPLIRVGIDVNERDQYGRSALHWAAQKPSQSASSLELYQVAVELVRHGGHALHWGARNKRNRTPLDSARQRARKYSLDENYYAIFELYTTCEVPSHLQYISAPQLAEVQDEGDVHPSPSLVSAGLRGDREAIGALIRRGAMVNERDDAGHTLLHLVAMGRVEDGYKVALEVVRHGGYGVDWRALTPKGKTAGQLARKRLQQEECEEAQKIVDLLKAHRLPHGERYVFPSMDPDYCRRCSSIENCICSDVPMPGAFYGP